MAEVEYEKNIVGEFVRFSKDKIVNRDGRCTGVSVPSYVLNEIKKWHR